ncbi:hypothetical protein [Chryseobacterium sp. MDT2-18]|uniref:hypothetical protein n=1 Tax=Chryseobacterium sp. MDT2-18 TaxID=1259136 RepID=UPI002781963F|nr:hypothetical protein [Chryseobacterium sp. MDT2-18]MDQ0477432.1 hypothetical protein [Chryseobacterium sp. MDT2-18]
MIFNFHKNTAKNVSKSSIHLINNCYKNYLNIDFKSIHTELNSYSTDNNHRLGIKDLDVITNPIRFTNSKNEVFELISYQNKNYLISESNCFPCSKVIENIHGDRWVFILLIPNGDKILINNDNSSVKYSFYNLKLFDYLNSFEDLISFDQIYCDTFSENEWYTSTERIQLIVRSKANENDVLNALLKLKLLNAFQYSIITIVDKLNINKHDISNYVLNNDSIDLSLSYITSPNFKIKISESTNKMLKSEDFSTFIDSLTDQEAKQFFEIEFLEEHLNLENIYLAFKSDILGIKILERWYDAGAQINVSEYFQERLRTMNINENLIREYYKKLKNNLRSIENKIRSNKGYNIVGSLYNESLLFNLIKEVFPNYEIISQYSPEWLGRQRIDIFIKELNIAIEYNGKQHYESIKYFGGDEGLKKTIYRDNIKKRKCLQNSCKLVIVKYNEDLTDFVNNLKTENSDGADL